MITGTELMRTIAAAFEGDEVRPLMAALHADIVGKSAPKYPGALEMVPPA
jgi:hypothetical protein